MKVNSNKKNSPGTLFPSPSFNFRKLTMGGPETLARKGSKRSSLHWSVATSTSAAARTWVQSSTPSCCRTNRQVEAASEAEGAASRAVVAATKEVSCWPSSWRTTCQATCASDLLPGPLGLEKTSLWEPKNLKIVSSPGCLLNKVWREGESNISAATPCLATAH